jgi:hypothetical protein
MQANFFPALPFGEREKKISRTGVQQLQDDNPSMHLVCELSPFVLQPNIQAPKLIYWLKDIAISVNLFTQTSNYTSKYEALLANALNLKPPLPLTALQRYWQGLETSLQAWGTLQLVHWQVGRDEIVLHPQLELHVTQAEHEAIERSIAPLLAEDGFTLYAQSAGSWHMSGADLAQLECATPERAAGRDMRSFAPKSVNTTSKTTARKWQRIANELQMLLYTHAVNDARAANSKLTLNAVWLSSCGALPKPAPAAPAWTHVYVNSVDALEAALEKHQPATLTLCGQSACVTLQKQPAWKRIFKRTPTLEALTITLSDVP